MSENRDKNHKQGRMKTFVKYRVYKMKKLSHIQRLMVVSGICLLTAWYLYWLVTKLTMRTSGAYLICLLYLFTLMVVKICNIKKYIFTNTCATCSELPSYTSTTTYISIHRCCNTKQRIICNGVLLIWRL